MADQNGFEIALLLFVTSERGRLHAEGLGDALGRAIPAFEATDSCGFNVDDSIQYSIQRISSPASLFERLVEILSEPQARQVIVVSDELVAAGGGRASDLAARIRKLFLDDRHVRRGHLCGLVGLVEGDDRRISDIDFLVDARSTDLAIARGAINRTADGLWLKSPRCKPIRFDDRDAITVHVVNSPSQLRDCFRLRHQVYDSMGYLDPSTSAAPSAIEIDAFDLNSIHFAATDRTTGDVVGTMRLVLQDVPRHVRSATVGRPPRVIEQQRNWIGDIARDVREGIFREALQRALVLPLPILDNSDFGERWPEFLDNNRTKYGGEISRLVIAPRYQGLGVSRLLIRAGVAVALDLQKRFLLLECIPAHTKMYQKYGFLALKGHHCRARGLDQIAVGMRLDLGDGPLNPAVSVATRDIEMIRRGPHDPSGLFGSKTLCLCRDQRCWREGEYASRGTFGCALRDVYSDRLTPFSG